MWWLWATLLERHLITVAAICLLYYCVRITRDYRLRARLYRVSARLEDDALRLKYQQAMWVAGIYAAKPFRPVVSHSQAERALIHATVLRELITAKAGVPLPRSYLRSRRLLMREAKRYANAHRSLWL